MNGQLTTEYMTRKRRVTSPAPSTHLDEPSVIEVGAGVFKDTCLQLLDRVADGSTEVVVTKRGAAVARVVGVRESAPSAYGFLRGTVLRQGDIVSPDHDAWGER